MLISHRSSAFPLRDPERVSDLFVPVFLSLNLSKNFKKPLKNIIVL